MSYWTARRIAIIREFAAANKSYSDAADALGCTRNMVAGKATRLGIKFTCSSAPHKVARGSAHPNSKLHERDIPIIRGLLNFKTQKVIAGEFGVTPEAISKIANGRSWSHV